MRRARKQKPVLFGGTFLRLLVGSHNRKFSAHEDLLCARSAFFKQRFQPVRKDISGECAVCLHELEMTDTEYCKTCGQNFHVSCIKDWMKINHACPTCRTLWRRLSDLRTSTLDQLDPDGFEVYVQWLYSNQIPQYNRAADDRVVRLLKAHIVGVAIEDTDFLHAVRCETIETAIKARSQARITYAVVDFTYKNTNGPCPLRRFICDLYALPGCPESLKDSGNV
ncbi:hypothetical protein E8E12_011339 [Didymella heteroderae]|uniref:RING-type domain-containing protein n=1 Tax=Didymella heteroderae TaxID=1769908 RepID=A0A9P4X235_9PLEO|nr:hypothetical protein E8E12_011339 [Didymella heteroderae]